MMIDFKNYFPLKHAKGKAFCNRVTERKKLYSDIKSSQHVLLVSPRRFGKTSLVLYTAEEHNIIYERVDLFVAIDHRAIEELILKGCKSLINKLFTKIERGIDIIKNYFKNVKLKWIVGSDGVNIEIIPEKGIDSITSILETLKLVESVLKKINKPAILFIDEFQEIGKLAKGRGIEGAIRHVAEQTEYLTFVFSGSNRHLLRQMFDDRNRPLYNLCERINLSQISANSYKPFLNKIAIKNMG